MYEQVTERYVGADEVRDFLDALEPVGAARDRRAAAGGRRPRAVGGAVAGVAGAAARGVPGRRGRPGGGLGVTAFPFSALVGQEDLREALLACAVDPAIGGVLVRGETRHGQDDRRARARARCSTARWWSCRSAPPRTASLGTLDLDRALGEGKATFQPGLLANAHEGLLYVDEVNLLPDHLVDVLLDAAALGRVHVERDGISTSYDARFLLVGTMNPEEGDLRPQLLDRFGLSVEVVGSRDPEVRVEIVRRRLAFDRDPAAFTARFAEQERALAATMPRPRGAARDVRLPGPHPAADRRRLRPARRGRPPRRHRHRPHRHGARGAGRRRRGRRRPRPPRREARARPPPPPRPAPAAGARRRRARPGAERLRAGRRPAAARRATTAARRRPARTRAGDDGPPPARIFARPRGASRIARAPRPANAWTPLTRPATRRCSRSPARAAARPADARARRPASPSTPSPPRAP